MNDKTLQESTSASALKWRRFVDAYMANGFDKRAAAVEAGYNKDDAASIASYLLTRPEVQRHIRRKMAVAAEKYAITQDGLMEMYEDAFLIAKEERNISGMISAADKMGELAGLVSTVKKIDAKIQTTSDATVTVKQPEIEERLKRLRGEIDAFLQ